MVHGLYNGIFISMAHGFYNVPGSILISMARGLYNDPSGILIPMTHVLYMLNVAVLVTMGTFSVVYSSIDPINTP